MEKIWITSDLHFGHNKPFIYKPRGFNSIKEHDEKIIKKWNSIVKPDDTVYILGDIMLNDNNAGMEKLRKLNGWKYLAIGNHDTEIRIPLYRTIWNVRKVEYVYQIRYKGINFYMTHYPTLTDNFDYNKPLKSRTINLCGHRHIQDPFADWDKGFIFHTELDTNNCEPWLLDDIIIKIKEKING